MSSRFVAAGSEQSSGSAPGNDSWEKARYEVESKKNVSSRELGKQDDGKSLFEVLQANKVAKQEAFDEASKLRNQFRPLDDSEVEFLDSIREAERAKEDAVRQETSEQLDVFRKQQSQIQQAPRDLENDSKDTEQEPNNSWKTSKKRRREKKDEDGPMLKSSKPSMSESEQTRSSSGSFSNNEKSSKDGSKLRSDHPSMTPTQASNNSSQAVKPGGLGLWAYDSDED